MNEMEIQILIIVIVFLSFGIFLLIDLLNSIISNKIHRSYHRGYDRAKDDKVKYYSTLHSLNDKYNEVMESLKTTEVVLKVITVEKFIEFENMLKDYQN